MEDTLEALDARLKTILPEEYQETYESMQPTAMGSAGLKYGTDGKVAWDQIWGSFCDLAMAGGPPHKGTLLEPGSAASIEAEPERYADVVAEICRGIEMVTELPAEPAPVPGWVRVECLTETMAGWLLRAIVMENVAVRGSASSEGGLMLDLPAAPSYQIGKEIKNVVTVIAKTCHYWLGHMPRVQQRAIAALFASLASESPLVAPALADSSQDTIAEAIARDTGLHRSRHRYTGWLGLECANIDAAVWMMRALVASNILSRREGTVLFVPVNPITDPDGDRVIRAVVRVHHFATTRHGRGTAWRSM